MTSLETGNPYNAPRTVHSSRLTAKGYSTADCLVLFLTLGLTMGLLSGAATYALNVINASILLHLLPNGVAFSLSLWLGVGRFIRRISAPRMILMILGCIVSVAITAVVYVYLQPSPPFAPQPWWRWKIVKGYSYAPAIGGLMVTTTLRLASCRAPIRVHLIIWLVIWVCGFIAFFVVEELGSRRGVFYEPTLAFICTTVFVSVVTALIGWQLTEANCEQNRFEPPTLVETKSR